ncbi:T9SS type A sorting domain-containing protein [Parvicella tangerina]|uniref:Secretion system C-terminal sorting domain-containing protein n=1 Tax=Parvicella tangerina TaxID=2829795 RepID=A0A916JNV7_9FLAO|nr:T9SS type A sorting domain-containing protein [Parvicella tangerina]CAG5083721.1 hypothetical protein CRYO30217_02272 [Parvicella tangerina]
MKRQLLATLLIGSTFGAIAQNVNIPDANFKAYLVGNSAINTNSDSEIQVSEAQAYTGTINCGNMGIADMTGIEEFVNIDYLYCHQNQLTSLDLSNNTALTYFNCRNNGSQFTSITFGTNNTLTNIVAYDNGFTSLDVSGLSALESLDCKQNQLTSLNVSNCASLTSLVCNDNQLTALDVSTNSSLENLECYNNLLTSVAFNNSNLLTLQSQNNNLPSIDLSSLTSLEFANLTQNSLTSLDLSNNSALTTIWFSANLVSSIDVSGLTNLAHLECNSNSLTILDITNNSNLNNLEVNGNALTELNVANGNNSNFSNFSAINNSGLSCVQVDDVIYSMNNWNSDIDATANFSEACNCIVNIPDANFKADLVGDPTINTNGDTEIDCAEASSFSGTMHSSNENISDLTGIEAFTSLTQLECSTNQLTSIDLSNNTALTLVNCAKNQLTNLNLSNNTALEVLNCSENLLATLDLSPNTSLVQLNCFDNELTALNLANGNNTNFTGSPYTKQNPDLACIEVDDAAYSTANWTNIDATTSFSEDCATFSTVQEEYINVGIYPNPTNGVFSVRAEHMKPASYEVVNLSGEIILSGAINSANTTIDLSSYSAGVYFLKLEMLSSSKTLKLIKR